jgi:GTP cyclohydrolase I
MHKSTKQINLSFKLMTDENKQKILFSIPSNDPTSKQDKIELLMREILKTVNPNMSQEIMEKTPLRYAKALLEFTKSYNDNITEAIGEAVFDNEGYNELIIVRDINFSSICEHHMLPFFGTVDIGYIPKDKIFGLSKFPRLVDYLSKKMHLQERLTKEIADTIDRTLNPEGVIVTINSSHSCMCFRGIKSYDSKTQTIYTLGCMKKFENVQKFLALLNK